MIIDHAILILGRKLKATSKGTLFLTSHKLSRKACDSTIFLRLDLAPDY
jgi:hypothetical protein